MIHRQWSDLTPSRTCVDVAIRLPASRISRDFWSRRAGGDSRPCRPTRRGVLLPVGAGDHGRLALPVRQHAERPLRPTLAAHARRAKLPGAGRPDARRQGALRQGHRQRRRARQGQYRPPRLRRSLREFFHIAYWLARTYASGAKPPADAAFRIEALPRVTQVRDDRRSRNCRRSARRFKETVEAREDGGSRAARQRGRPSGA